MSRVWSPNPMERKCLEHLDASGSWRILNYERPDEAEVLSWRPFGRIFAFNFVLFAAILALLFFVLELSSGVAPSDLREDLPFGLGGVLVLSAALGVYATHLYRRSWNGRARSLGRADERFGD